MSNKEYTKLTKKLIQLIKDGDAIIEQLEKWRSRDYTSINKNEINSSIVNSIKKWQENAILELEANKMTLEGIKFDNILKGNFNFISPPIIDPLGLSKQFDTLKLAKDELINICSKIETQNVANSNAQTEKLDNLAKRNKRDAKSKSKAYSESNSLEMKNYIGLIVAVENYHNSDKLRQVKFAINDAKAFRDSLLSLGCDESNLYYLSDNTATKTTIEEKIKELSQTASENDTIIFYYAGHGLFYNGENLITCVDTSVKSLDSTTVQLHTILAALEKSNSKKIIAFLDCCHSGIEFSEIERSPVNDFSADDLKYEYRNAEHLIVFASCKSDQKSQGDIERKHGVWSYYLIQALSGKAKTIYDGCILFSDKLQKYLGDNTYQRVKAITTDKKNQTPVKFGKETAEKFIVADLSKIFEEKELKVKAEGIRFEKAILLTNEEDWVRSLPGFGPKHKAPKQIDAYHENWIKKIAVELIKDELDAIARKLRDKLNYKRKDIEEPVIEDGFGQLSTIDFDYIISITQSQERADKFVLTRSIENFKNSDILKNSEFNKIFSNSFDELQLRMNKRISITDIIDIIEAFDNSDLISVEYETTDTSNCDIYLKDFQGKIILAETTFTIKMNKKDSPQNLIQSCQGAYKFLNQNGVSKLLGH
jgi:hypothetical protein